MLRPATGGAGRGARNRRPRGPSGPPRRPDAPAETVSGSALRLLPPEHFPNAPAAPPVDEGGVKVSPFERSRRRRSVLIHYALAASGACALALLLVLLFLNSNGWQESG